MQSHFFAFSPSPSAIATSRRIASERLGSSSCDAAHLSTVSRSSFESLMAVTGSRPVAGRPRPFFGTTLFDFAIKCSTIKASRGEARSTSAPALTRASGNREQAQASATRVASGRRGRERAKPRQSAQHHRAVGENHRQPHPAHSRQHRRITCPFPRTPTKGRLGGCCCRGHSFPCRRNSCSRR